MNSVSLTKLGFLTAGIPNSAASPRSYDNAFDTLEEMNLDGMELEFVHGVNISADNKKIVQNRGKNFMLTAHAPYYINLNAKEEEKVQNSINYIVQTAAAGAELGLSSIVYHAGFYLKEEPKKVFKNMQKNHERLFGELKLRNIIQVYIRPETTGKPTQWGSVEEIVAMSKIFAPQMLPCVDFSHLYARANGAYNTYDDFAATLQFIGDELGQAALDNFHAHVAGMFYGLKGEKKHLNLLECEFNYKDLLKALKTFNVKGFLVCESPNIEDDAALLKAYYESLSR